VKSVTHHPPDNRTSSDIEEPPSPSRRRFIRNLGTAGAAGALAAAGGIDALLVGTAHGQVLDSAAQTGVQGPGAAAAGRQRANQSYNIRVAAAYAEKRVALPAHPNNGDEDLYPNRIGNYSKGLAHDQFGEVAPDSYASLLSALASGDPSDFEKIILGGSVPLVDPQSGLAFDLEGTDSHQLAFAPAPALASAWRAGEAVEVYWQALMRDVPFSQYAVSPLAAAAIDDLNALSDFRGPRDSSTGKVTAATLFRGFTAADLVGPYLSQYLLQPFNYGAIPLTQRIVTDLPLGAGGADYMIEFPEWLAVQNGQGPFGARYVDPTARYIRSGRDLAAYVHVDVLFQEYLNACIYLIDSGAPFNPGNPYVHSRTQTGFGTFGAPHVKSLLAEVATRALKAVWFQKWFVHRTLRPEEFGGLCHLTMTQQKSYPLNSDLLNCAAMTEVSSRDGTYLLPHAFPEGCPQHPSYGQGHATVAGACATIVKAFFDETWVLPNPVMATDDGLALVPYVGADAGRITVGGELNKIVANVGLGRAHAAVHWRSDYQQSVLLGEAVAISVLADQRATFNENFSGCTFTKFDGTSITV
jgi:hypothetical protein